jgi:hypothetical protein
MKKTKNARTFDYDENMDFLGQFIAVNYFPQIDI